MDSYDITPESEAGKVLVDQLVEAQMNGYRDGFMKGIALAEHFTGADLTVIRESMQEAWGAV